MSQPLHPPHAAPSPEIPLNCAIRAAAPIPPHANEQVYDYDSVYRLTFVDYNDGNDMTFVYDALGNRRRTINGGTVSYQTNNLNQYTSVGGTSHTYDDNGNLAFDGRFRYYYDCENRLTDVNDANDAPWLPTPTTTQAGGFPGRSTARPM